MFSRGNRKQIVFTDDRDRRKFLGDVEAAVTARGWRLLAYCLMTNHFHLLVQTSKPDLGRGMQQILSRYATRFNARHDLSSHLFHRPYGSKRARDNATAMYFATYIALNPVRAKMVDEPGEYLWSSHAAVAGLVTPAKWLAPGALLELFADEPGEARRRYLNVIDTVRLLGAAGFDPVTAEHAT